MVDKLNIPLKEFPTLVCIILFIDCIQLLCTGILSSYISKIYLEVKNRPKYIIKSKVNMDASIKNNKNDLSRFNIDNLSDKKNKYMRCR